MVLSLKLSSTILLLALICKTAKTLKLTKASVHQPSNFSIDTFPTWLRYKIEDCSFADLLYDLTVQYQVSLQTVSSIGCPFKNQGQSS